MVRPNKRKPNVIPGTSIPIIGQKHIVDLIFDRWWEEHKKEYNLTEDNKDVIKTAFKDGMSSAEIMMG